LVVSELFVTWSFEDHQYCCAFVPDGVHKCSYTLGGAGSSSLSLEVLRNPCARLTWSARWLGGIFVCRSTYMSYKRSSHPIINPNPPVAHYKLCQKWGWID
jgi:hypothetical protein